MSEPISEPTPVASDPPPAAPDPSARKSKIQWTPEQQAEINRMQAEDRRKNEARARKDSEAVESQLRNLQTQLSELSGKLGGEVAAKNELAAKLDAQTKTLTEVQTTFENYKLDTALASHPDIYFDPTTSSYFRNDLKARLENGFLTVEIGGKREPVDVVLEKLPLNVRRSHAASGVGSHSGNGNGQSGPQGPGSVDVKNLLQQPNGMKRYNELRRTPEGRRQLGLEK